ncbi:phosphoadenosine phosphosulfate reductase (plasmid) [Thioalkalivibrio sp. K90mix]|uniref:phosphoadenosine phosphosulfate reductase domain-containing protein n=1 Tax=Thioalkalivibrio sp. (strain K90mix) TaxID=396595 RepID=UPI0001C65CBC|nr:phosphoadenosine phosphosulfate reductase family protein [Thioalkalivibrio sp. K90mix]ADC73199.1 phosphoadenosine phosphosulfate reductase [Thioalkalivibrio sp. K90mix]
MSIPMDTSALRAHALDQFRDLFAKNEVLAFATSFGKDSTASLNLGLEAAIAHRQAGGDVPPILVLHTDTTVENPAVRVYADRMIEHVETFAAAHGLDVRVKVSKPSLLSQWPVHVVSGRRLPTFANRAHRRCSVEYKRSPAERTLKVAQGVLEAEGHDRMPVVVLGTRMDESAGRAIRMTRRGEGAHVNETRDPDTGTVTARSFAPLADWSTDDVWAYLADAGRDHAYPGFAPDFTDTIELYRDSAGECVIVNAVASSTPAAACGARHGCWACTVSGSSDKSMETLLAQPQYAYMQGLNDLRNWLVATQHDFSKRRWIGRKADPVTGHIPIIPGDYSADTARWLLAVLISLDCAEAERAAAFRRSVETGEVENDPGVRSLRAEAADPERVERKVQRYIETMQRPQFRIITPEVLLAIDFLWSVDALHAPHEALRVWQEVVEEGHRVFAPGYTPETPQQPAPAKAWHPPLPAPAITGIHGAVAEAADESGCALYSIRPVRGEDVRPDGRVVTREHREATEAVASINEGEAFGFDAEGMTLFLEHEWDACLRLNRDWHTGAARTSRTEAALRYLRLGVVNVASGRAAQVASMVERGQRWERAGLHGQAAPDAILGRCLDDAAHTALRDRQMEDADQQADVERAIEARMDARYARRSGLGESAGRIRLARQRMKRELPRLRARMLALESAVDEGLTHVDGEAVFSALSRFSRDWKEWRRLALDGDNAAHLAPLFLRIEASVQADLARVLAEPEANALRFLLGFGMALSYRNAEARAAQARQASERARQEREGWRLGDAQFALPGFG